MPTSLLLYPLSFILLIICTKHKKKHLLFLCFVSLYLFSSLTACYIYEDYYNDFTIYPSAVLFHISMLVLLLLPLKKFDRIRIEPLEKSKQNVIQILTWIVIVCCMVKLLTDLPNISVKNILTDVHSLRMSMIEGEIVHSSNIIVTYLSFLGFHCWMLALVLAFYYLAFYPKKKAVIILLFISSLNVISGALVVAGREAILKYLLIFFILTYVFSAHLSKTIVKKIYVTLFCLACSFVSIFLIVTLLRFSSDGDNSEAIDSILSYCGQGFIYFSSYFEEFFWGVTGGKMKFSFFVGDFISSFNIHEIVNTNLPTNIFTTTIGSWVFDVGVFWTVLIVLIHYFIFKRVAKSKLTVFKLTYIIWIYGFMFSSLFFYNEALSGARICTILFVLVFEKLSRVSFRVH